MKILQSIQIDINKQKQDMKEMEKNIKESINKNIDEKFNHIEIRTSQLEKKIEDQQKTIELLDRKLRRRNLIFFGIEEKENNFEELLNLILDILKNKMKINCQRWELESVSRLGRNKGQCRPVVVTVTTTSRKLEILTCKYSLKDTNIYIKEDYPPTVLKKRKELQEELKRERDSGKRVALRYDKIVTLPSQKFKTPSYNERTSNKRFLSESPEIIKVNDTEEMKKQVFKKNKSQNITSFLNRSPVNPSTLKNNNVKDNQKN